MTISIVGWLSLIIAVFGALVALYLTAPDGRRAVWIQLAIWAWAMGLLAWLAHVDHVKSLF